MYSEQFFIEEYQNGKSAYALSKITGVGKQRILKILHKNDVEIRHNNVSEEKKSEILELFNKGMNANQIATALHITYYPVLRVLKENSLIYKPMTICYQEKRKCAVEDYVNGVPVSTILKKYNIAYSVLYRGLNDSGIERRAEAYNKVPKHLRDLVVSEYNEGSNICELHEKYGYGTTTISRWVHSDSKMRSLSDAFSLSATKGRKHFRGKNLPFISEKNKETFFADSTYEYARMKQLDNDEKVLKWSKITPRIPYKTKDGKNHYYVPDFVITYENEIFIEEIKPSTLIKNEVNKIKFEAAKKFCKENGYTFRLLTEKEIGLEFIKTCEYDGIAKITIEERKKHDKAVRKQRYERNFFIKKNKKRTE